MELPPNLDIDPKPFLAAMDKMAGEIGQLLANTDLDPANKELMEGIHGWMIQEKSSLRGQLDAAITQLQKDYSQILIQAKDISRAQEIQLEKLNRLAAETKMAAEKSKQEILEYQKQQAQIPPPEIPETLPKPQPLALSPGEELIGLLFPPPARDAGIKITGKIWEGWKEGTAPDPGILKELLDEDEERNLDKDKDSGVSPAPGQDNLRNIWE